MAGVADRDGRAADAVVLAGDSHLAFMNRERLDQLEALLPGTAAHNCAAGGATSADLLRQAPVLARLAPSVVIVSVGTNDAMPSRRVALQPFRANLEQVLGAFDGARCVGVGPPPAEARFEAEGGPSAQTLRSYHEEVRSVCASLGAGFVDAWALFEPLRRSGTAYHVEDGVHLDERGYGLLVPAIASVVSDRRGAERTTRGRS